MPGPPLVNSPDAVSPPAAPLPVGAPPLLPPATLAPPVVPPPATLAPPVVSPVVTTPVATPPVGTPPAVTPPVISTPVTTPPVVTPPVISTPVTTPPVVTTPPGVAPVTTPPPATTDPVADAPPVTTTPPVADRGPVTVPDGGPVTPSPAPADTTGETPRRPITESAGPATPPPPTARPDSPDQAPASGTQPRGDQQTPNRPDDDRPADHTPDHTPDSQPDTRPDPLPDDRADRGPDATANPPAQTPVPVAEDGTALPVADPVRPEQWQPHRADAPAPTVVVVPAPADATPAQQPGQRPDPLARTTVQRVQADDGRWVRTLTVEIPVHAGEGVTPGQVPDVEQRLRDLADQHVNHGLLLPDSGDQLHVDLRLVPVPETTTDAVVLTASPVPTASDSTTFHTYLPTPGTPPAEVARLRLGADHAALTQALRHAGLDTAGPSATQSGPATPPPAVRPEHLRTVDALTTPPSSKAATPPAPLGAPVQGVTDSGPAPRPTPATGDTVPNRGDAPLTPEQRAAEVRAQRARRHAADRPDPLRPVSTHPAIAAIERMSPQERADRATDAQWVSEKRRELEPRHFAHVAAALMVTTPPGVHQPAAAARQARRVVADMLRSTEMAQRLLLSGTRIVIIPADQSLTQLPEFASLAGNRTKAQVDWDGVRGVSRADRTIGVGEENLLGTPSRFAANADGYSILTHEMAHALHRVLADRPNGRPLGDNPLDRAAAVITAAHRAGVRLDDSPNGPARRRRKNGSWTQPNYAIRDQEEFFAQLTNAWLGSNSGKDPFTRLPMRNDQQWVTQFVDRVVRTDPDTATRAPGEALSAAEQEARDAVAWERQLAQRLVPLLLELYGPRRTAGIGPYNPSEAVREENEVWNAFRSLWDGPDGPDPALGQGTLPFVPRPESDAPDSRRDGTAERPVSPETGALAAPGTSRREVLETILTGALGNDARNRNDFAPMIDVLNALDRPFRPLNYDLPAISREILQLSPDADVPPGRIREALGVANSARRDGFADSVTTMALYRLQRLGVLTDSSLLGPADTPRGRDLSGGSIPAGATLARMGTDLAAGRADGTVPAAVDSAPPWPGDAFVYAPERTEPGRVRLHGERGPVEISDALFARLVALDPNRPAGRDLVLALPQDGSALARQVADAANVRVWSNDGAFRWAPTAESGGAPVPVQYRTAENMPYGEWSANVPGLVPDNADAAWRDAGNQRHLDRDTRFWTVSTEDGRAGAGAVFLTPDEMARVEDDVRELSAVAHFSHRRDTDPLGIRQGDEYGLTRLAQPLTSSYTAFLHGRTDLAQLPDGKRGFNLRGPEIGGFLARRKSIQNLPAHHDIFLISCQSATMHPTRDPLHDVPVPQHIANRTDRTVWASDRPMELHGAEDGLPPRLVLKEESGQPDGTVHAFHPEPDDATRAEIVTHTRLSPQASDPGTRVVTWVRALRTLGDRDIDVDPDRNREYSLRLYGFAALENERLAANPEAGPLTWAELRSLVETESARHGYPNVPFDLASLTFTLQQAHDRARGGDGGFRGAPLHGSDVDMRDADSSSELSDLSDTPSLPDPLVPDSPTADAPGADGRRSPVVTESEGAAESRAAVHDPGRAESTEHIAEIARRTPAERDALMGDPAWVAQQRQTLPQAQFAELAAVLMVRQAPGVEQPVSARQAMRRHVADMLVDPEVTELLLRLQTQITILPRDTSLVDVAPVHRSPGMRASERWTYTRGMAKDLVGLAFVGEETLVGASGRYGRYFEGGSVITHETGHVIHEALVEYRGTNPVLLNARETIQRTFERARATEVERRRTIDREIAAVTGQPNEAAEIQRILNDPRHRGFPWPNGEFAHRRPDGTWTGPNYSASNSHEFFAELTNAYLDLNREVAIVGERRSGAAWVRANADPGVSVTPPPDRPDAPLHHIPRELMQLLVQLYGDRTTVPGTERNETALPPANPLRETARMDGVLNAAREFTDHQEATAARERQLLDVLGPAAREHPSFRGVVDQLRLADDLRTVDPVHGEGPLDLRQLTRDLLQMPHGDVTPLHVRQALEAAVAAYGAGARTLTQAAAHRLLVGGALGDRSRLEGAGDAFQGRVLSDDDPGIDLSTVALRNGAGAVAHRPAPWRADTYALLVHRTPDGHYRVRLDDGTAEVTAPVLAELLRLDPDGRGRGQIALLSADPGHHLAALVANATGARVWSTTQRLTPLPSPNDPDQYTVVADAVGMQGTDLWVPTDSGNRPGDPTTSVTLHDGTALASGDIASRSMLDGPQDARQVTRVSFVHIDQNVLPAVQMMATAIDSHVRSTYGDRAAGSINLALIGRGDGQSPQIHLTSAPTQPRHLSGQEAVRFLTRGRNLRALPPGAAISLMWPGFTTPTTTDPLTDTPPAQQLANHAERTVYAVDAAPAPGRPPGVRAFHPDPTPQQIREHLHTTALGPVPRAEERVTRWVRALRSLYGPDIDRTPNRADEFRNLLHGMAVLERRQFRNATDPEPLTSDALRQHTADFHRDTPGMRVDADTIRLMLLRLAMSESLGIGGGGLRGVDRPDTGADSDTEMRDASDDNSASDLSDLSDAPSLSESATLDLFGRDPVDYGLYQPESHETIAEIGRMSSDERARLANDPAYIADLKTKLMPPQYIEAAAALMLHLAPGVERPAAARHAARRRLADIFRSNTAVVDMLLAAGTRFLVLARAVPVTDTAPLHLRLREQQVADGVPWNRVRGVTTATGSPVVAFGEENLTGALPLFSQAAPGQSVLSHETAHAVHRMLSEYRGSDKRFATAADVIQRAFDTAKAKEDARTAKIDKKIAPFRGAPDEIARTRAAIAAHPDKSSWPNGEYRTYRDDGTWSEVNYSATNVHEFFAELSSSWLGTNAGRDSFTGRPRNNGPDWVRAHYGAPMVRLLTFLYGDRTAPPRDEDGRVLPSPYHIPDENPLTETYTSDQWLARAGDFLPHRDADLARVEQLLRVFGPPLRANAKMLDIYSALFLAGEDLRAADPAHGPRPADLVSLVAEVLQRPPRHVRYDDVGPALKAIEYGQRNDAKTLTQVAVIRLQELGVLDGTELLANGAELGWALSGPVPAPRLDETAVLRPDGSVERRPAPWPQPAMVLDVVATEDGRYVARVDGEIVTLTLPVLADLIAGALEHLDSRPAALVLSRPDPDRHLATALAAATDIVSYSTADVEARPSADASGRSVLVRRSGALWVATTPSTSPVPAPGTVTLAGNILHDGQILSRSVVSEDGQREAGRTYGSTTRVSAAYLRNALTAVSQILAARDGLPGALPPLFVTGDGNNSQPLLYTRSPRQPVPATPEQVMQLLGRAHSLRQTSDHSGLLLIWPELDTAPATPRDPLVTPEPLQALADARGGSLFIPQPGGGFREIAPQPNAERLAEISSLTGLGPVDRAEERVRRWVRAARLMTGMPIDTMPAQTARFEQLMHGFAALERTRLRVSPTADPWSTASLTAYLQDHRSALPPGTNAWGVLEHLLDQSAAQERPRVATVHAIRTGEAATTDTPSAPALPPPPVDPNLYQAESHQATADISLMSEAERDRFARDPQRVAALRDRLTPPQFAEAAAALMLNLLPGVERPVAARHAARRRLADLLRDNHDTIGLLLGRGTRFLLMGRTTAITNTGPGYRARRAITGFATPTATIRGITRDATVILGEENLLGEASFQQFGEGLSVLAHEAGHAVHNALLHYRGADPQFRSAASVIQGVYDAFTAIDTARAERIEQRIEKAKGKPGWIGRIDRIVEEEANTGAPWPNGPHRRFQTDGTWGEPNYSSTNVHEFFAELTAAWLGTNHGTDGFSSLPRNNGAQWVIDAYTTAPATEGGADAGSDSSSGGRSDSTSENGSDSAESTGTPDTSVRAPRPDVSQRAKPLVALLQRLYGDRVPPDPDAMQIDTESFVTPPADNPVAWARRENDTHDALGAFWNRVEGDRYLNDQLVAVYGPEVSRDQARFRELADGFARGETMRSMDPARAPRPWDLVSLAREVLQLPRGELTPSHVDSALDTLRDAQSRGFSTLTAAAAFRLRSLGANDGALSLLTAADGRVQGRSYSGDGPALRLDEIAVTTPEGVTRRPAPWPGQVFAVDVERTGDGRYLVRTRHNSFDVDATTLAHVIGHGDMTAPTPYGQPGSPLGANRPAGPIVLTRPDPGQLLSALLANLLQTRVWSTDGSPEGPALLSPAAGPGPGVLLRDADQPWIPTDPGTLPGPRPAQVLAADGAVFADGSLLASPLLDADGQRVAGRSFTPPDRIDRAAMAQFTDAVSRHVRNRLGAGATRPFFTVVGQGDASGPVVWAADTPGTPRPLSERETVSLLTRAQSLRNLGRTEGLMLVWPGLSSQRLPDPLSEITAAQRLANGLRATVYVPVPRPGRPTEVRSFAPEPDGAGIARIATLTALGPVPHAAERVTRWVRALRAIYGSDIDVNPTRTEEFEQRLYGIAALERLALRSDAGAPPLSWDDIGRTMNAEWKKLPAGTSRVEAMTVALDRFAAQEEGARPGPAAPATHAMDSGPSAAPPTAARDDSPAPPARTPQERLEEAREGAGLLRWESTQEAAEIGRLSSAERAAYAADAARVDALRNRLTPPQFAEAAAALMLHAAPGVEQPVAARHAARRVMADMLRAPEVTGLLLEGQSRVVLMSRYNNLLYTAPVHRATRDDVSRNPAVPYIRGVANAAGTVVFGEETVLGEDTPYSLLDEGASVLTHELAHAIHTVLDSYDGPTALLRSASDDIQDLYEAALQREDDYLAGKVDSGFPWPNGTYRVDGDQGPAFNYSASDAREFFAELTAAWLGTNIGPDGFTGLPRNNGAAWVTAEKQLAGMVALLTHLYGDRTTLAPIVDNPRSEAQQDSALYQSFTDFWQQQVYETQLIEARGAQVRDDNERFSTLIEAIGQANQLYPDTTAMSAPYDLRAFSREILQQPHGELTDADVGAALIAAADARDNGLLTFSQASALHLLDIGAHHDARSLLTDADGNRQGRSYSRDSRVLETGTVVVESADGRAVAHRAPWPPGAHVVDLLRTDDGRLSVRTDRGTAEVRDLVLAALIGRDSERTPRADILLVVHDPGQHLAALVARTTGSRVWSSQTPVFVRSPEGHPGPADLVARPRAGHDPRPWIPTDPGPAPVVPQGPLVLADGAVFTADTMTDRVELSEDGHGLRGLNLLPGDTRIPPLTPDQRSALDQHLTGTYGPHATAWSRFTVVGESTDGTPLLPDADGRPRPLSGGDAARLLGRAQALRSQPDQGSVLLLWPGLATHPGGDLLADIAPAQQVANDSRQPVLAIEDSGAPGARPTVTEFLPEPDAWQIQNFGLQAALGPVPRAEERVVRWVRTIRALRGNDINIDPAREQDFQELLHGTAALERLRLSAESDPEPLTWADLVRHTRQWLTDRSSSAAVGPGPMVAMLRELAAFEDGTFRTLYGAPPRWTPGTGPGGNPAPAPVGPATARPVTWSGDGPAPSHPYRPEGTPEIAALSALSPAERREFATSRTRIAELRARLGDSGFREAAWALMLHSAPGVERPVTARHAARARLTDMVRDPQVLTELLAADSRVVMTPRVISLLDTAPLHRGTRQALGTMPEAHTVRGLVDPDSRTALIGEETVTGESSPAADRVGQADLRQAGLPTDDTSGPYRMAEGPDFTDGYSVLTHETAHLVHHALLNYRGDDTELRAAADLIQRTYDGALQQETDRQQRIDETVQRSQGRPDAADTLARLAEAEQDTGFPWPDGRFTARADDGTESGPNYSASNVYEFFAQLTAAWLGTNHGTDTTTDLPRNNGAAWVRDHYRSPDPADGVQDRDRPDPAEIVALLTRLYGDRAPVEGGGPTDRRDGADLPRDYPVESVGAETAALRDAALLFRDAEQEAARRDQLLSVFGAELAQSPDRYRRLHSQFRTAEGLWRADTDARDGDADLRALARVVLQRPHGELTAADVESALRFTAEADLQLRPTTLTEVAALRLDRAGAHADSLRISHDDTERGIAYSGPVDLAPDRVAERDAGGAVTFRDAPWPAGSWLVGASRGDDGMLLVRTGEQTVPVSDAVFVELVDRDFARDEDADVVLLADDPDQRLATALAAALGTRVWSADSALSTTPSPRPEDGGRSVVVTDRASDAPASRWIPTDRGPLPGRAEGAVTFTDGAVFADTTVRSRTLLSPDGQQQAGQSFRPEDPRSERVATLVSNAVTRWMEQQGPNAPHTEGLFTVVGPGGDGMRLRGADGPETRAVSPAEAAAHLARSHRLRTLGPDVGLALLWPGFDTAPTGDPLAAVTPAQRLANDTDRVVYTLRNAPGGPPQVTAVRPEPAPETVDRLLQLTALGPVDQAPERVARWVRLLRDLHGPTIDTDPSRIDTFHDALHGLAALERVRLASEPGAPPLTYAALHQDTRVWAEAHGVPHDTTGPALLAVLAELARSEHPTYGDGASDAGSERHGAPHDRAPRPGPLTLGPSTATDGTAPSRRTSTDGDTARRPASPPGGQLSRFARLIGSPENSHAGLVTLSPPPLSVVRQLHDAVIDSVAARGAVIDDARRSDFREQLMRQLGRREIVQHRAALLTRQGHPVTLSINGSERTIHVRLGYTGIRPSAQFADPASRPDFAQAGSTEGKQTDTRTTQRTANLRTLPLGYVHTLPMDGAVWLADLAFTLNLTHHELTVDTTVTDHLSVHSELSSPHGQYPLDARATWVITHEDGHDGGAGTSTDPLTLWLPRSRALTEGTEPGSQTADLTGLPVWAVESTGDAVSLLPDLQERIARLDEDELSPESAAELRTFLADEGLRATAHLQTGLTPAGEGDGSHGGAVSPILYDTKGRPVGFLQLSAEITPTGAPLTVDDGTTVGTAFGHGGSGDRKATLSRGAGVDVRGGVFATSGFPDGASGPTAQVGGGGGGRLAHSSKVTDSLQVASSASLVHGLSSKAHSLLTEATVRYTATFYGTHGTPTVERFGTAPTAPPAAGTPAPYRLLVASADAATARGTVPTAAERRALPPHLDALRGIGIDVVPTRLDIDPTTLDAAETALREQGFLPPAERSRTDGGSLQREQLENLRKLKKLRGRWGLAMSVPDAVDGGRSLWFEAGGKRARLTLDTLPDPSRDATHERRLPGVDVKGGRRSDVAVSAARNREHTNTGGMTGRLYGPLGGYWAPGQVDGSMSMHPKSGSDLKQTVKQEGNLSHPATGSDLFRVPVRYRLGLTIGKDTTYLTGDPTAARHGDLESGRPQDPAGAFRDGTLDLVVDHGQTVEPPAPRRTRPATTSTEASSSTAPAPTVPSAALTTPDARAGLPPAHSEPRVVDAATAADHRRRLGRSEPGGNGRPATVALPLRSTVLDFHASAAVTAAVQTALDTVSPRSAATRDATAARDTAAPTLPAPATPAQGDTPAGTGA
ncbi:hypothetical protein HCN52_10035, partial [Streptomyces bohaiensis]|nr:hypothetical protein [Streptomyces bohaiensis]